MTHSDDRELATAYAQTALSIMQEQGIAPTPPNYEVWYTFAGKRNSALSTALTERLEATQPFTEEVNSDLHERFFGSGRINDTVMDVSGHMLTELDKVRDAISSAEEDTSAFGATLSGVSSELANSIPTAQAIIENLLAATKRMQSRTQQLEGQLQTTTSEMDRLKSHLNTIREESLTDQLTRLANRRQFDQTLTKTLTIARKTGAPQCLVMADIDRFKGINDTYGHQTGDQILRLVAMCIQDAVRSDDTPARYGGEEFAIILPNTPLEAAEVLAERIRRSVESKQVVKRSTGEDLGTVTISLGIALLNADDTEGSLIERADACLYASKRGGRNRVTDERALSAADTPRTAAQ